MTEHSSETSSIWDLNKNGGVILRESLFSILRVLLFSFVIKIFYDFLKDLFIFMYYFFVAALGFHCCL